MKSCSRKILELFYNAKHSGRIIKPEAVGRVGEDNDGLVIELTWRVVNDIIEDAKFRAFGNPNAIAITSLMTSNIIGKSVDEAVMINEDVIKEGLDEILPEYIEAFDMVKSAIIEAYNNYLKRNKRVRNEVEPTDQVEYADVVEDDNTEVDEELDIVQEAVPTVIVTQSRGRGRPRKERVEPEIVGEKRGRGRPRKIVPEGEIVEPTEKRGRGRPRKIVDITEVVEQGEKRGRGRPRKIVDESQIIETAEKRGRGRPRKERVEPEIVGEKRGRGRPRKIVDEDQMTEPAEKRGRGRPRKIVDESQIIEPAEKRGRGRPRKLSIETLEPVKQDFYAEEHQNKISLPNDLAEVINDEDVDELINGKHQTQETDTFVNDLIANRAVEQDDDIFDSDYDIFKSNIRSILSGHEKSKQEYTHSHSSSLSVDNKAVEQAEAVETDDEVKEEAYISAESDVSNSTEDISEKRGRGRPRKIVVESEDTQPAEKRGRGRPRLNTVNSLTRSLTTNGGSKYSNHDIVFASKNVTTTNININVTKTTTNVEDDKSYTDDYQKNINILNVQENSNISTPASMVKQDDEIEIEPVSTVEYNTDAPKQFNDLSDDELEELDEEVEEEVDASDIKDEAPKGIEDLLKALLQDD